MIAKFYDTERGGFYQSLAAPDPHPPDEGGLRRRGTLGQFGRDSGPSTGLGRSPSARTSRDVADKSLRLFGPRLLKMPECGAQFFFARWSSR